MVNLLFIEDEDLLTKPGIVKTMLDPACGTGGMLSVAEDHLRVAQPAGPAGGVRPGVERRDVRDLPLGHDAQGPGRHQHRLRQQLQRGRPPGRAASTTCSPTRRSGWSGRRSQTSSATSTSRKGFAGRFGAGLPRINDGSFLFLQHMISKMKPVEQGGSRLAIVFNGSPLFTGAAGSGESEIRRWIIENDWLEAVVALPDQLFYNTGISTYFWIVTNRKAPERRGKVQLVDARELLREDAQEPRREAQGDQRRRRSTRSPASTATSPRASKVKIFPNEAFGFLRITVERPLRLRWEITDDTIAAVARGQGHPEAARRCAGRCP